MTLASLLEQADIAVPTPSDVATHWVTGVTRDSRQVVAGHVFVAICGEHADGHEFLHDAARRGAMLALVEYPVADAPLPTIQVPSTRSALADLACALHASPTDGLTLVGITGTNGKTTTAYLMESVLHATGHVPLLLGTVATRLAGRQLNTGNGIVQRTTAEAPDLQALFARALADGATAAVMEVSSHALAQDRVRGCHFDVAVFANLTQDHLDYHGTMADYFEVKARLFEEMEPGAAVINVDDPWGRRLADRLTRPLTFGMQPNPARPPDLFPMDLVMDTDGIRFNVGTPAGPVEIDSPLVGTHNIYNILATVAASLALGFSPEQIRRGIAGARPVPGRLERVDAGQPFIVLVDYAHTPDALERLMDAVHPLVQSVDGPVGRVLTVVGCGGERDTTKRGPMGAAAARGSHTVYFTADNPRSEDPEAICEAMAEGAREVTGANIQVIPDRTVAIIAALREATIGDVVVIAGKGHETVQIIGTEHLPFNDREVALAQLGRMSLSARHGGTP